MKTASIYTVCCLFALVGCAEKGIHTHPTSTPTETSPPVTTPTTAPTNDAPRTLVDVPFLEGMPLDNRVGDPTMELGTVSWFFEDAMTGDLTTHVKKAAFAQSPAGQSALYFPSAENENGVVFGARFKIPAGGYVASYWVAVPMGSSNNGFSAGVITFDLGGTGQPRYIALDPDAKSSVDVGGVHWVSYRASVTPDVVAGWGYLYGVTDGSTDTWIGAPLVRATPTSAEHLVSSSRAINAREARFIQHAQAPVPVPTIPHNGFATRSGPQDRLIR